MNSKESLSLRDVQGKIVIIGNECVGKSCFINSYTGGDFSENYSATIGIDFRARTFEMEERLVSLILWDTGGQPRFHAIARQYFKGSKGFIIVMDLTDSTTLETVKFWKKVLDEHPSGNKKPQILAVGTKADLEDMREITYDEAKKVTDELNIMYMEVSAKTRKNISKAFEILIRNMISIL